MVGCAGADDPDSRQIRTCSWAGGVSEVVGDAAWAAFAFNLRNGDTAVSNGLTVLDARASGDSGGEIQKERSKLLVVLAPPGDDSAD